MNFRTKLTQKWFFQSKKENHKNHHRILHILVSLGSIFQFQQLWFFETNFPKRILPIETKKKEHHHWFVHIRVILSTKFQLELTILICWTKFAQKSISSLKKIKWTPPSGPNLEYWSSVRYCKKWHLNFNTYSNLLKGFTTK